MFVRPGNERALETWEEVRTVEKEIWPGGTAGCRSKLEMEVGDQGGI